LIIPQEEVEARRLAHEADLQACRDKARADLTAAKAEAVEDREGMRAAMRAEAEAEVQEERREVMEQMKAEVGELNGGVPHIVRVGQHTVALHVRTTNTTAANISTKSTTFDLLVFVCCVCNDACLGGAAAVSTPAGRGVSKSS
jgi:hypothetical protein